MFYRKKPIIVEAHQWFPQPAPKMPVDDKDPGIARKREKYGVRFCPATKVDMSATRGIIVDRPACYVIDTLEGPMDVRAGDWIVTGIKGERYAVRQDIFALTYEEFQCQENTILSKSKPHWLTKLKRLFS